MEWLMLTMLELKTPIDWFVIQSILRVAHEDVDAITPDERELPFWLGIGENGTFAWICM